MSKMAHVWPFLAEGYGTALEDIANAWFASGGENHLQALDALWLQTYLDTVPN